MMVGRLVSFWNGIFSGAMLNFQGVDSLDWMNIHLNPPKNERSLEWELNLDTHIYHSTKIFGGFIWNGNFPAPKKTHHIPPVQGGLATHLSFLQRMSSTPWSWTSIAWAKFSTLPSGQLVNWWRLWVFWRSFWRSFSHSIFKNKHIWHELI